MSQSEKSDVSIVSYDAVSAKAQYGEAVRLFLMDCRFRNLSPYTIEGYHVYLKSLQRDLEAWQLTLDTLTLKDLAVRMVNEMLDKKLKPNTVNGKIRTLQQFFKFLYQDGRTETNLADGLKPIKNNRKMIHTFTEEQVQRILASADQTTLTGLRDYTIMLLFLETGMRVMEMSQLKLSDLNFEENMIQIQMSKGRKFRSIPIQVTCIHTLKRYLEERGDQLFDQLWITVFDTPLTRNSIINLVKDHMNKAELACKELAIFSDTHGEIFPDEWRRYFHPAVSPRSC